MRKQRQWLFTVVIHLLLYKPCCLVMLFVESKLSLKGLYQLSPENWVFRSIMMEVFVFSENRASNHPVQRTVGQLRCPPAATFTVRVLESIQ